MGWPTMEKVWVSPGSGSVTEGVAEPTVSSAVVMLALVAVGAWLAPVTWIVAVPSTDSPPVSVARNVKLSSPAKPMFAV